MDGEKRIQKNKTKSADERMSEIERKVAELEGRDPEQPSVTVDYQEMNLKKLTITNDKEVYEKIKHHKNIDVLFDPIAFLKSGFNTNDEIYIIGILQDK